jgi:seryl-tRNA synthetase
MLDIKFIRENEKEVALNVKNRGVLVDIKKLLSLDDERKALISSVEELRAEKNRSSKTKPSPEEIDKLKSLGEKLKGLEEKLGFVEASYFELLKKVPNMTHPKSPVGGEEDYKIIHQSGEVESPAFNPIDHEELALKLDLLDFERGAKVASSKFYFSKNELVRLNQALINYGMDILDKHGFIVMETPDIAKNAIIDGIGFSPRGPESQVYNIENTEISLVGTAEITLGGFHSDEVLDLTNGPLKYAGLSHCFRTEAGAYGRTSKGLYRVHQFTKLEMFVYCKPNESEKMLDELLSIEKEIVEGLEIPYRVIDTPTGDLGGPAYRKFDIESWMVMKGDEGSKGGFGEITSASNCTDYQARRLNIKYRKPDGKTELVHTLNGTAIVLTRFPLAIIENHQQADGSIKIPKALHRYLNFKQITNSD